MRNRKSMMLSLVAGMTVLACGTSKCQGQVYVGHPARGYAYAPAYFPAVSVTNYRVSPYAYGAYRPHYPAPVAITRVAVPYAVAVPVPVPVPVRPVYVRPKYYVWGQPVRNTVRAFTP